MSRFATLLDAHTGSLAERWAIGFRDGVPPYSARLQAQLPVVLRALSLSLRHGAVGVPDTSSGPFVFDLQGLVQEYALLSQAVFELAQKTDTPLSLAEMRVFTEFMSALVADGVASSTRLREELARAQEAAAQHSRSEHQRAVESASSRPSEERLRRVLEVAVAGTWELDVPSGRVVVDSALRALHGYPIEGALTLETALSPLHPEDGPKVRAALESVLSSREPRFRLEYRATDATGQSRWLEACGRALFDASGRARQVLGTSVDITSRKEAELTREGLLAALQAQPLLLVCVLEGPEYIVTLVNDEYRAQVTPNREIVGQPIFTALPHLGPFAPMLAQVRETGVPFVARNVPVQARGAERFYDFVVQPVRGPSGSVDRLLNISINVTHLVDSQRMLEKAAAKERERAEFERQLIGIVGHDLGNPIAAMKLGIGLLLRTQSLDAGSLKLAGQMKTTLDGMMRQVNDLLDFTEARAGHGLTIARERMDLHLVIQQVADEVQMTFPTRELELEQEGDGEGSWDRQRMAQVALNLISNALKHSPSDTTVRVRTRAEAKWVELKVSNQGRPIPPEVLPVLFEPMQRGAVSAAPLGLGLSVVKHIVDALGGTIAVTSSAEAGTAFTLRFPRAEV